MIEKSIKYQFTWYFNIFSSAFFDSDIVLKSLRELLPSDARIERGNYHFLLIQILESPVNHMTTYTMLSDKLSTNFLQVIVDFWLIDWCLMPTLAVFKLYHGG